MDSDAGDPNPSEVELEDALLPVEAGAIGFALGSRCRLPASPERIVDLDAPWRDVAELGGYPSAVLLNLANHLPMTELRRFLHRALHAVPVGGVVHFLARNPDVIGGVPWAGEAVTVSGEPEIHRPLRHYLELLRLHPCRVRTPQPKGEPRDGIAPFLLWSAVSEESPVAASEPAAKDGKYGPHTEYRRFNRLEEPEILDDLLYGAARLGVKPRERVLSLGVNDGRELEVLAEVGDARSENYWGIDADADAIDRARERFPDGHFRHADLDGLGALDLPTFEVVLALNVLHCTTIDRDALLRSLKSVMASRCRVLLSLPNCHFGNGDILRRPLDRNHPRHDRSLVYKDARMLARWLYRAGFDAIETFGTYDVFLLGKRSD